MGFAASLIGRKVDKAPFRYGRVNNRFDKIGDKHAFYFAYCKPWFVTCVAAKFFIRKGFEGMVVL